MIRGQSLIINLPGQPKSIQETLEGLKGGTASQVVPGIFAAVPYCIDLIGGPYLETHEAVCKAFRPKSAVRPDARRILNPYLPDQLRELVGFEAFLQGRVVGHASRILARGGQLLDGLPQQRDLVLLRGGVVDQAVHGLRQRIVVLA